MKKTSKNKIEEFIRVDHAGERGAIKIYEGQLLALNTLVKDESLKKKVEEMKVHEKEHLNFIEKEPSLTGSKDIFLSSLKALFIALSTSEAKVSAV